MEGYNIKNNSNENNKMIRDCFMYKKIIKGIKLEPPENTEN